ncbi:hypothetical protein OPV22_003914 [Ensete ventricosum]|uniref:Uncharacterized protein n=1 Tax=Ensete ventricosum TaxID=4639 RepID=A0AAV8S1Y6_ENSVE|nr:hypothetical protein OPV22_003914 [Ensete ventricosum]
MHEVMELLRRGNCKEVSHPTRGILAGSSRPWAVDSLNTFVRWFLAMSQSKFTALGFSVRVSMENLLRERGVEEQKFAVLGDGTHALLHAVMKPITAKHKHIQEVSLATTSALSHMHHADLVKTLADAFICSALQNSVGMHAIDGTNS